MTENGLRERLAEALDIASCWHHEEYGISGACVSCQLDRLLPVVEREINSSKESEKR